VARARPRRADEGPVDRAPRDDEHLPLVRVARHRPLPRRRPGAPGHRRVGDQRGRLRAAERAGRQRGAPDRERADGRVGDRPLVAVPGAGRAFPDAACPL
jgi:hypothetical protein